MGAYGEEGPEILDGVEHRVAIDGRLLVPRAAKVLQGSAVLRTFWSYVPGDGVVVVSARGDLEGGLGHGDH